MTKMTDAEYLASYSHQPLLGTRRRDTIFSLIAAVVILGLGIAALLG